MKIKKKCLMVFTLVLLVTLITSLFYSTIFIRGDRFTSDIEKTTNLKPEKNSKETEVSCNTAQKTPEALKDESIDFLKKYPEILNCKNIYNRWKIDVKIEPSEQKYNFTKPADKKYHDTRFIRGVILYFPITSISSNHFKYELKWLYRSWIHMIKFEPPKWRTDLIVFIENNVTIVNSDEFFMKEMNCRFENKRKSAEDKPMCTLINHVALKKRNFDTPNRVFANDDEKYRYLLKDVNIFKTDNSSEFDTFYKFLKLSLSNYGYLDSILMAFDGYEYFKSAGYDFLVRSDMDVFLTPLFGKWLPRFCNDFNVGRGGFSHDFNVKRLSRAAKNVGLKPGLVRNLGSTWYSTPEQFRLVSYLTLFGMAYLAQEEFTKVEREGKLGVKLWPEWHFGVLLLYGQSMALNHLIASKQAHVMKLDSHLDYPSRNNNSIHSVLNIHVYHGDGMFSKFEFKKGKYDEMNATDSDKIMYYCLKMALDGKRMSGSQLYNMLVEHSNSKV